MHIASQPMTEVAGGMFLVWTLIAGEPHIPIDAKHRAAVGARVGDELLADLGQVWRHRHNELRHRQLHAFLEARLIRLEPCAFVVRLKLAEEGEAVLWKALKTVLHSRSQFCSTIGTPIKTDIQSSDNDFAIGDLFLKRAAHSGRNDNSPTSCLDDFHSDAGTVGGVAQSGVTLDPRLIPGAVGLEQRTRVRTGFLNYVGHYYNNQNAPPNVNFQCTMSGGTVGGGALPCAISNYTGLEPFYYTFDLSLGYDTGDMPANDYLKHIGVRLVLQNIMNKLPAFEYQIAAGSTPTAFDVTKSDLGRTIEIILTKTW